MTFDPQDPQWTAYVLGELDGQERAAVEQQLETTPAARQFVDELRRTVGQLDAAMQAEPAARLSEEQRASVLTEVVQPAGSVETALSPRRSHRRALVLLFAIAASLLVAVIVGSRTYQLPRGRLDKTAMATKPFTTQNSTEIENFDIGAVPNDPTGLNTGTLTIEAPKFDLNTNPSPEPFVEQGGGQSKGTTVPGLGGLDLKAIGDSTLNKNVGTKSTEQLGVAPAPIDASSSLSGQNGRHAMAGADGGTPAAPHPVNIAKTARQAQSGYGRSGGSVLIDSPVAPSSGDRSGITSAQVAAGFGGRGDESRRNLPELKLQTESGLIFGNEVRRPANDEDYTTVADNPFLGTADNPLSTFSVDVDTAAYANLRRFLLQNRQLPPPAAVRIEELINYFRYDYPQSANNVPFAVVTEVAGCPWNAEHRLLRIGIKGRDMASESRPASNLVFLIDVSGSMNQPNKLPLVKEALRLLIGQLHENDRVAVVVYAGSSGLVLPSTTGDQRDKILAAIDNLQAGGSTNGGQGIQLAYDIAAGNFIKGGTNRVILATDGDFNVGITDHESLVKLIEDKAKSGVFLTTLGFGMGNLKDSTLEQLADKGNGNYAYIDGIREARKVFVEQMTGTLVTIAKDVKLQLEFNPAQIGSYRLIGYENRVLRHEDFNNDKKDAGDIGAGHTVTALFELVPAGTPAAPAVDALKYQRPTNLTEAAKNGEIVTLKLRYKQPDGDKSQLIEQPVTDGGKTSAAASVDFKFASAVALFGMLLRDSPYHGTASFDMVQQLAQEGRGSDRASYRAEFMQLVAVAKQLRENK